jgi:anti-sigma B factor antagonist
VRRRDENPLSSTTQSTPDPPLREALRPSGPARFELGIDHRPNEVVVRVDGELDILTTPKLAARLNGVIRACDTDVVLDLRRLEFIDSAGLQILLNIRRRLMRGSRTLSVICDDGPVKEVIELTRLTEALRVTSS